MSIVLPKAGTQIHRCHFSVSALFVLLTFAPGLAQADPLIKNQNEPTQTQEIPRIHRQTKHRSSRHKAARSQVTEIPQRFLGCWHGAVSQAQLTKLELLSPPRIDVWLTKNYRVCFAREGAELKVTIADSGVDPNGQVLRATSSLEPTRASGNEVELDGWLTLVERTSSLAGVATGAPAVVVEQVKLLGELHEKDVMTVHGQVLGYYNGHPWWVGQWNCTFEHQP
jgi:hypothetical protein